MIYVENGHFLYNIIGDPEFQWKHKRILFIGSHKNEVIIDDKYQMSSVFSINDIKNYILSYIDIRYDKKLHKSYEDKQIYLQYMKKIVHDAYNCWECMELLEKILSYVHDL